MSKVAEKVANELHKPARKIFPRRRVVSYGKDDLWQADLVDMKKYSTKNKNFTFILTIIDVYTKYAWAVPLKNKSSTEVKSAFEKVLINRSPKNLQTDRGLEFFNKHFRMLMKNKNINHYSTYSRIKAAVVERFNRTLKEKMWKKFTTNRSYSWINIIADLITNYNNTKHSAIGTTPSIASRNPGNVSFKRLPNLKYNKKFNIGDKVRLSKHKAVFSKGYTQNWTSEVFTIAKIRDTKPVVYELTDENNRPINGCFYEHELGKTQFPEVYLVEKIIKKNKDKCFVKFVGLDNSHNKWIDSIDII